MSSKQSSSRNMEKKKAVDRGYYDPDPLRDSSSMQRMESEVEPGQGRGNGPNSPPPATGGGGNQNANNLNQSFLPKGEQEQYDYEFSQHSQDNYNAQSLETARNSKMNYSVSKIPSSYDVIINGKQYKATDSEEEHSFMSNEALAKLHGVARPAKRKITFTSSSGKRVESKLKASVKLGTKNSKKGVIEVDFYVVPEKAIRKPIVLGTMLLSDLQQRKWLPREDSTLATTGQASSFTGYGDSTSANMEPTSYAEYQYSNQQIRTAQYTSYSNASSPSGPSECIPRYSPPFEGNQEYQSSSHLSYIDTPSSAVTASTDPSQRRDPQNARLNSPATWYDEDEYSSRQNDRLD